MIKYLHIAASFWYYLLFFLQEFADTVVDSRVQYPGLGNFMIIVFYKSYFTWKETFSI